MDLLHRLQGLARRLRPALRLFVGLGVLSLLLAACLVLFADPETSDPLLLSSVVALLWCLCAAVFITTFETVPPPAGMSRRRWPRLKRGIARMWYRLLALAFLGLTIAALLLSKRLIDEALG